jgi:hypothetical protein
LRASCFWIASSVPDDVFPQAVPFTQHTSFMTIHDVVRSGFLRTAKLDPRTVVTSQSDTLRHSATPQRKHSTSLRNKPRQQF